MLPKEEQTAKAVYKNNKFPYSKGTYKTLDHYAICCPGCKRDLEIKLYEDLRNPDEIIVKVRKQK